MAVVTAPARTAMGAPAVAAAVAAVLAAGTSLAAVRHRALIAHCLASPVRTQCGDHNNAGVRRGDKAVRRR
jgi:hypothetical protein